MISSTSSQQQPNPREIFIRSSSPFTPTQYQELEHQALIYKYMVSGVPIPTDLLNNLKRSLLFPNNPSIGWGCFQVGFGRKSDPEPGRCRRTDGKKWRCAKEAYPDSKYCERHMHRGRNRSRKPVENNNNTSSTSSISSVSASASGNMMSSGSGSSGVSLNRSMNRTKDNIFIYDTSSSATSSLQQREYLSPKTNFFSPFVYPHKTSFVPSGFVSSSSSSLHHHNQNNTTHQLFLDSSSASSSDKDFRYLNGMREGVVMDERDFFQEATVHQQQLNSFKGYSDSSADDHNNQSQHCFVLGTDFKSSPSLRPLKIDKDHEVHQQEHDHVVDDSHKQLHHFFGEWPPKNSDSWLDLASHSRVHN